MERYRNGPEDPRPLNHANDDGTAPSATVSPAGFSPADAPYLRPQTKLQPPPKANGPAAGRPSAIPHASWTQNIWQTQPQGSGAFQPGAVQPMPYSPAENGETGMPVFAWTQNFWPATQTNPPGGQVPYPAQPSRPQAAPVFTWTQNYWPQPYGQPSALWPNDSEPMTVYPPVDRVPTTGAFMPAAAPGPSVERPGPCNFACQPVPGQSIRYQPVYACPMTYWDATGSCPAARNRNEPSSVPEPTVRYQHVPRQPDTARFQPATRQSAPPCDSWRTIPERTMAYRSPRRDPGGTRPAGVDSHVGRQTKREWQPVKGQTYVSPDHMASQSTRQTPLETSRPFRAEPMNSEPRFGPITQTTQAEDVIKAGTPQQKTNEIAPPAEPASARAPEGARVPEMSPADSVREEGGNVLHRRRTDIPTNPVESGVPLPISAPATPLPGEPVSREENRPRFDGATSARWAIRMAPLPEGRVAAPEPAASPENLTARNFPLAEQVGKTAIQSVTSRSARYNTPQATTPMESADEPADRTNDYLPKPDLPLLRETGTGNHPRMRLGARRLKWITAAAVVVALTMAGVQSGLLGRFSELITSAPVPLEGSQTVAAWPTDLTTVQPVGTAQLVSASVSPEETTAPASLTFTLTTDSAATAVRLVTDKGEMLRATTSSAPQGNGLVWHISAQLENPYSGAVRIFLRDAAGGWTEGSVSCAVKVQ